MFWNKSPQEQHDEHPEGPSMMEKGKVPQRCPSISSTQSSIDSPPKVHSKLPKATPPPYYSSAKFTTTSSIASSTAEFDRSKDLSSAGTGTGTAYGAGGVRTRRPPSFCRRHWFVITVVVLVTATCGLAVMGVMLQKHKPSQAVFLPSQMTQPAEGDDPNTFSYYSFTNVLEQDWRTITGWKSLAFGFFALSLYTSLLCPPFRYVCTIFRFRQDKTSTRFSFPFCLYHQPLAFLPTTLKARYPVRLDEQFSRSTLSSSSIPQQRQRHCSL